jgi:hypothetical protein
MSRPRRRILPTFNNVYQARIEWRLLLAPDSRRRPFATIVRWNTSVATDLGDSVRGQVLVVTRLGPGAVCHIGYVDGLANATANELARTIADAHAASFRCDVDRPVIVGNTGAGFSAPGEARRR